MALTYIFSSISHKILPNNNNNKYISRVLNPSVSNLHEAQSTVHVQLKLRKPHTQSKSSKQRNQRRQKKPGTGRWKGKVQTLSKQPIIHCRTFSLTQSPPVSPPNIKYLPELLKLSDYAEWISNSTSNTLSDMLTCWETSMRNPLFILLPLLKGNTSFLLT